MVSTFDFRREIILIHKTGESGQNAQLAAVVVGRPVIVSIVVRSIAVGVVIPANTATQSRWIVRKEVRNVALHDGMLRRVCGAEIIGCH